MIQKICIPSKGSLQHFLSAAGKSALNITGRKRLGTPPRQRNANSSHSEKWAPQKKASSQNWLTWRLPHKEMSQVGQSAWSETRDANPTLFLGPRWMATVLLACPWVMGKGPIRMRPSFRLDQGCLSAKTTSWSSQAHFALWQLARVNCWLMMSAWRRLRQSAWLGNQGSVISDHGLAALSPHLGVAWLPARPRAPRSASLFACRAAHRSAQRSRAPAHCPAPWRCRGPLARRLVRREKRPPAMAPLGLAQL